MTDKGCENCFFRRRYDNKPGSLLGRLWRWHINWCPGWKRYMRSLPSEERVVMADRYGLKKHPDNL